MGKTCRSKRSGNIGKGKVTPTQIAFLVDRYLCDNRFSGTRTIFRTEASSIISKSPIREVPKSLLSLDDIVNEYICLKEQKVAVDLERARLDQEKIRVQNLLHGMQDVMNSYNASLTAPPPPTQQAAPPNALTSQQRNNGASSSGCTPYNTPNVMSLSLLGNKRVEFGNFSAPLTVQSITGKRKGPEVSGIAPPVSRKTRTSSHENPAMNGTNTIPQADRMATNLSSETQRLANNHTTNELAGNGSSVVKCLFSKAALSPPTSSTCPKTPQKEVTSTNCTIVTKERFTISPDKQLASYTVERSHLISSSSPAKSNLKMSNKKSHVKGRLNFDNTDSAMCLEATSTADLVPASSSGSEQETDLFDMDFSNLDFLGGENFSFSELLVDFDLGYEGSANNCLTQTPNAAIDTASGSSPESDNGNLEPDQYNIPT